MDYLIIDEVSIIGCKLLLTIHEALCEAKENTKPFGGINIICARDFAQLPAVGDTRVYSHVNSKEAATQSGQKDIFRKVLWLSVDNVVLLHQLVQQDSTSDSKFTELLGHLQTGFCTDEDYIFLNSKQLHNIQTNFHDPLWASALILISNHDVKDTLNLEAVQAFASRTNQQLHFYYAMDRCKDHIINDNELKQKELSYHSDKTDQHLGILPLCKGMPVMLTHDYIVLDSIINGTIRTLEKINYTIDDMRSSP